MTTILRNIAFGSAAPDEIVSDGKDIFIIRDGVKIAKRGRPNTRHAKTWVPLEPGWAVRDADEGAAIEVEFMGTMKQPQ